MFHILYYAMHDIKPLKSIHANKLINFMTNFVEDVKIAVRMS